MTLEKTLEWLTVYAQPFFYGAITRLPFIYFVIHMRFVFELDWNQIGIFVGSYQATRVVTSVASIFCPRLAHFIGTVAGLAGNALVILSDDDNKTNVILGTILIGASETLAAMQTYVKRRYGSDLEGLEVKLKVQYAAVMVGVVVAFSLGGFVYQHFGMKGVAFFGAIMSTGELMSLMAYFVLDPCSRSESVALEESAAVSNPAGLTPDSERSIDAPQDPTSRQLMDAFSDSGMGATYLNYVLLLTFGMEAITIGYNLSISPVYITEVFQRNTTVVGIMLASGAAFGTFFTIAIALTKRGKDCMESLLPSPVGFLVAMAGISGAVMIAAVPVFPVHVLGLLFLMGFNDLAALLLNEMQGSITSSKAYSIIGPMGQVVRRCGNVVTAMTGPILYGIMPQLPYMVAGSVTAFWTILLAVVILHRTKHHENTMSMSFAEIPRSVSRDYTSSTFSRREILVRQVKKGKVSFAASTDSEDSASDGTPDPFSSQALEEIIEIEV